jgi:hypothetical protein
LRNTFIYLVLHVMPLVCNTGQIIKHIVAVYQNILFCDLFVYIEYYLVSLFLVAWMPCMALGVARECVSYDWQKCSGANCTQIEVCETPDPGKRAHCYATWRNETGNITVLMQGCWLDAEDCYDHKRCEEREWETNKPYFCCCDGNVCNTPDNLYYVPSPIIDDSTLRMLYNYNFTCTLLFV